MSEQSLDSNQLSALADEWIAERNIFISSMHAYLHTHLKNDDPNKTLQALDIPSYQDAIAAISTRLCEFVIAMESTPGYALRSPDRLAAFQRDIEARFGDSSTADDDRMAGLQPPANYTVTHDALRRGLGLKHYILQVLKESRGQFNFTVLSLTPRLVSQIKYCMYPIRNQLPVWQQYWLLDNADVSGYEPLTPHPESGIHRYEINDLRSIYTDYVPEYYNPEKPWPLILSMHGGSGNDEDFLWVWLKYAKNHGYLLVSAKSFGPSWHTWDANSILLILEDMQARYHIDPNRILLTGLSDGASFGYELGFAHPNRFTALAVVAGILRPHQRHPNAAQLPVYIAHGDQDQLFPIAFIRSLSRQLEAWGHDVTYHEILSFGHAYPPGENTAILDWFARQSRLTNKMCRASIMEHPQSSFSLHKRRC